ncbi:hypothetical protein [Erythrobacter sp. WG]|uniref:hypothetical protein n=1 Tax=Erythrobacter sp. WG TaxID=2985510 RepID=UPI00226EA3E6|nr:hypothetical protein [Erythrobacter sp. WG]MCX9146616.1 hypothetical protein [Erythrobacter sp. WG]
MTLLDRVRLRVATDLPDEELEAMIDAIALELDARFGGAGAITVELGDPLDPASRFRTTLRLTRPADVAQPITVTEIDPGNTGNAADEKVLAPSDFRLTHGGRTLQRLTGGPNGLPYWAPLVRVTYTPVGLAAARDEVTIKLIALDLSYRGALRSERAGDYQFTLSGDMAADREAILRTLEDRRGMMMA